jgi:uncharacterized protein (DUF4415 family)
MIKRYQLDPKNPPQLAKSDLTRIDRMRDDEIDYSDIPELDEEFCKTAVQVWPPAKKQLTIRLDTDVLEWLKRQGRGYQTRINRILRVAMEGRPTRRRSPDAKTRNTGR